MSRKVKTTVAWSMHVPEETEQRPHSDAIVRDRPQQHGESEFPFSPKSIAARVQLFGFPGELSTIGDQSHPFASLNKAAFDVSPAPYQILASRHFLSWLNEFELSLAFTTYQAGRLFLIGTKPDGTISGFERLFERTMGLWSDGQAMWLSSAYQIWRLQNSLSEGSVTSDGYDRCFVPQVGYTTGDIDVHDLAIDAEGRPVFVSTLFGCLATVSDRNSFEPLWQPSFLSKLAAEDRCHLNGLAMQDGRPKYVTACSRSDVVDGWRDHRVGGGVVVDVETNEIVCQNLSMPHSPRLHNGRLWLLDSATGFLGYVDEQSGQFEQVTFCPGYARGLAFHGNFAVVGLSKCRNERTFSGLPLQDGLQQRNGSARCGLAVIDLQSGDIVSWLRIDGCIEELYDVVVLSNVMRPKALGFKTDEIRNTVVLSDGDRLRSWRGASAESP